MNLSFAIVLLILDFIWINIFMINPYKYLVNYIQNEPIKVNFTMAVLAYIFMILGLYIFVLPNIKQDDLFNDSLKYGFTFGIIVYGIYNFTCATIFKNWNLNLLIIDILWGGLLYYLTIIICFKLKLN